MSVLLGKGFNTTMKQNIGNIKHSNADISKAKELLGYDPEWSFERGIAAAIQWYKENL